MYIYKKRHKKPQRNRSARYRAALKNKNKKRKLRMSGLPH